MRVRRPKRGRKPVKRLDLTDMRHVFRDRRLWSAIAIVTAPPGESHFDIVQSGDSSVDIVVECITQPGLEHVTCRIAGGVWDVPDVGDEVAIVFPEGERDFMPIIVARLSTGNVPKTDDDQGPKPGRIVISRGAVFVHDGNGGALPLALKQDVINVDNKHSDHKHIDSTGGATSGELANTTSLFPDTSGGAVQNPPNPAFPGDPHPFLKPPLPGTPTFEQYSAGASPPNATITGTTVLFGK